MPINLAALNTITATTSAFSSVSTGGSTIINAVPSNHVYKLGSVVAVNKTGTLATVTLYLNRYSTTNYVLAYQIGVPANASLVVVGKDNPIYMMDTSSDILSAVAGTSSAIDIIASYEDMY